MEVEKGWFAPALQYGAEDVFLLEDWDESPAGPYRAVFHFRPDDTRTLYVSSEPGKELLLSIHRFDDTRVVDIDSRREDGRWLVDADTGDRGHLSIEIDFREKGLLKVVNPVSSRTPDFVARNPLYCRLMPKLAAPLLGTDPKQKISGVTELGRGCRFRMDKLFKVTGGRCSWGDEEVGPLNECDQCADLGDFGLVSTPIVSYLALFLE